MKPMAITVFITNCMCSTFLSVGNPTHIKLLSLKLLINKDLVQRLDSLYNFLGPVLIQKTKNVLVVFTLKENSTNCCNKTKKICTLAQHCWARVHLGGAV